jgi:RING finger protein 113A
MRKRTKATTRESKVVPIPTGPIELPTDSQMYQRNAPIVTVEKTKIQKTTQKIGSKTKQTDPIVDKPTQSIISMQEIKEKMKNDELNKEQKWLKQDFVLDQQLPICKDYMLTGYCTFGWSCKFLHTRDRIVTSYALDMLTEKQGLEEARKCMGGDKDITAEFRVCPICKKFYSDPVVLNCGHVFCKNCAMERFRNKDRTCFACGKDSEGIFNTYKQEKK